jgi:hypothetical protein
MVLGVLRAQPIRYDLLVELVQKLLTFWCSHDNYMVCHKNPKKCAYQYYQGILLDMKVDNLV